MLKTVDFLFQENYNKWRYRINSNWIHRIDYCSESDSVFEAGSGQ